MAISWQDILEQLSTNYSETWESDEMEMTPDEYDIWLEQQDEDTLLDLFNQFKPDEEQVSLEDVV